MVEKVIATETALALIESLKKKHGELIFHQSGGCCDTSAANCYLPGELTIGAGDVVQRSAQTASSSADSAMRN